MMRNDTGNAVVPVPGDLAEACLADIPVFCAHEHWGSIDPIGMLPEGFRGDVAPDALPTRPVSLWDIVLDPYFGGWVYASGHDPHHAARVQGHDTLGAWWQVAPDAALASIAPALRRQHLTGAFQCIRQGVRLLHGADIAEMTAEVWAKADSAVRLAYEDMFALYERAIALMNISNVIRPVHPEYFLRGADATIREYAFMRPIMRIDPLLALWPEECPRRDALAAATGVEPHDAPSWRAFLGALFDMAAARGNTGIKQLQAYTRPLDFAVHSDSEVVFRGALTDRERRGFENWVMHECCKQAHERRRPHQVHTGTHNLEQSSPMPLAALAKRYPNMNIVLLHCWPFVEESGFLAKHTPNIYLDPCWQTVLNPAFLEQSLSTWLGYVPASKMMCSQDATSIEMATGSVALARGLLGRTLRTWCDAWQLPEATLRAYARDILHNNAVDVYGVGAHCTG